MNSFWIILALILLALALPPALKKKSWLWFLASLVLAFAGVVLPLFIFCFSSFLMPEWKGACVHGWLDCFILGKLALAPLVLLATAALYAVEILRVEKRTERWLVVGVFLGAMISSVCFVFGLVSIGESAGAPMAWMLVPFYIAVGYSARAVQLIKEAKLGFKTYIGTLLGSLPFWATSALWSHNAFAALPDKQPPGCFIVTAAGRGHRKWVGPFFEINRNGRQFQANRQLITLWQFEDRWQSNSPRSHNLFRSFYNQIGPAIAAQIKSPWLADFTFIAIKPVELMALLVTSKPKIMKDFLK